MSRPLHDTASLIAALAPITPHTTTITPAAPTEQPAPLAVAAVVDGIQHTKTLRYLHGRPVVLAFLAAGAIDPTTGDLIRIEERLSLHCTRQDVGWLTATSRSSIPIETVDVHDIRHAEQAVAEQVNTHRHRLECQLVRRLLPHLPDNGHALVDGSVSSHPIDRRIVGLVKTTDTAYTPDDERLVHLSEGQTTSPFRTRWAHSTYLRLRDRDNRPWNHGLVRLEALDPDLLPRLATWALSHRQPTDTADPRGDRHLSPVAACERLLRTRTPAIFDLSL